MVNLPNIELNRAMFIADLRSFDIVEIFATHESNTSNSILTDYGKVMRVNTKNHKIFYEIDFAKLAIKQAKNEFDAEYDAICTRLKLRKRNK